MTYHCATPGDTMALGERIGRTARRGLVVSLRGSLGAGKTVLAKGIARGLGVEEAVVSPTFTLVQQYRGGRLPLTHIDLYRISGPEEFEAMGGEEMLYNDGVTLIEWSEKIDQMLPEGTVFIDIAINADQSRDLETRGLEP